MKKTLGTLLAVVLAGSIVLWGQQHNRRDQDEEDAAPRECVEQERQALQEGRGFGRAAVADDNGFPGPRHILDWKKQLDLKPAQEKRVETLAERTRSKAIAKGQELQAREQELSRLLSTSKPNPQAVQKLLGQIGAAEADLRWIHIGAHIEARDILTPQQLARYNELRERQDQRH